MAARLCPWVAEKLKGMGCEHVRPGYLVMHMASLHVFSGEDARLKREIDEWTSEQGRSVASHSGFDC